jgi:hypothetical protein
MLKPTGSSCHDWRLLSGKLEEAGNQSNISAGFSEFADDIQKRRTTQTFVKGCVLLAVMPHFG